MSQYFDKGDAALFAALAIGLVFVLIAALA